MSQNPPKRLTLIIPQADAEELTMDDETENGFKVIQRKYVESRRWHEVWEIVFTYFLHPNKYWRWTYRVPATENQDYDELDSDSSRTAEQVFRYTRIVEVYE